MSQNSTTPRVLGCDVGKDTIFVFDTATASTHTIDNTAKALNGFFARLDGEAFVVCEATGGYERCLLQAAVQAGHPAHRGDPRRISAYLRSLRAHAKTDRIDAQGLALYGAERHDRLTRWHPPAQNQEDLQDLVHLRSALVDTRADYKRRLKAPRPGPHKDHIADLIENLDKRIEAVERDIQELLDTDAHLASIVEVIEAIPGCGTRTAISIAATLPEIGQITRRRAASIAGLAPHPRDSGNTRGHRFVRGGRKQVKSALFIAAMVAKQHDPDLRAFAERITDQGKKRIVATIAVARKLITIINARVRDAIYMPRNQLS